MCLNSLAMGVWGWWAFDIFTLIASYMNTAAIAAQTILRTLGLITFMLPVGIMSASGTLIGNSVGAGRGDHAVLYYNTSMKMGVVLAFVQVLVLLIGEDLFILLFTNQEAVGEQMRLAWPLLMVFVVFDTTQGISSSVIRGTGQQRIGSYITSSAYWAFGIPISLLCVFVWEDGIRGLWFGPTFAVLYNTICYTFLIQRINWPDLVQKVKERRAKDKADNASKVAEQKTEAPKETESAN